MNSVVLPFEIRKSIGDCGHEEECKPVTLHVIQKVESAIEELEYLQSEMYEAEEARHEQFREWQEVIDNIPDKEIINKPTRYDFPAIGDTEKIYKAESESKLYQWNAAELKYEPLAFEEAEGTTGNITIIHGGGANGTA